MMADKVLYKKYDNLVKAAKLVTDDTSASLCRNVNPDVTTLGEGC